MSEPKRDAQGRFEKGSSGNELGRPRKERRRHSMPFKNRSVLFEIAAIEVPINVEGRLEKRSLYEANLLKLGANGANGHAPSARLFIQAIDRAAQENQQQSALIRMLLERIEELEERAAAIDKRFPTHGVVRVSPEELEEIQRAEAEELDQRRAAREAAGLIAERSASPHKIE